MTANRKFTDYIPEQPNLGAFQLAEAQIAVSIRTAMKHATELEQAVSDGNIIAIQNAAASMATAAQTVHVLGRSIEKRAVEHRNRRARI
jgi:hypothetical protein